MVLGSLRHLAKAVVAPIASQKAAEAPQDAALASLMRLRVATLPRLWNHDLSPQRAESRSRMRAQELAMARRTSLNQDDPCSVHLRERLRANESCSTNQDWARAANPVLSPRWALPIASAYLARRIWVFESSPCRTRLYLENATNC